MHFVNDAWERQYTDIFRDGKIELVFSFSIFSLAAPLPPDQLDKLVAESLRDEDSGDDESVDENDPELLVSYINLQVL